MVIWPISWEGVRSVGAVNERSSYGRQQLRGTAALLCPQR